MTREAVGAVGGVALLTVAMMVHVVSSPIATLMRDPIFLGTLIGYIGIAGASAFLFQRVSRISIGLDGILIGGSSRTRFFGYRDVDAARERGGDIELLRGDRVVLRLQLHGKDASRREALLERLREAITRAENLRGDPDAGFVASASVEDLTRAADGAASYRQALPTRDKLWQLFESPAIDSAARKAAGEALASGGDAGERARLRIAAEHCADPDARVRLHELLDDAKLNAEDEPPVRGRAKLSTSR